MKRFWSIILNILFFTIVAVLAISVATIALTKKVNEYRAENTNDIHGVVVKQIVPVLALSDGIVTSIKVKTGDHVKKGQVLVRIDNPMLRSKINSLKEFKDNVSAQTEAKVAEEELKNLIIVSSVDGIVGEITITEGGPVNDLSKAMEIYSSEHVRFLSELTVEEYQQVQKLQNIKAYSARLNQSFQVKAEKLKPEAEEDKEINAKKLGLYFVFADKSDAASLLHNEDLELKVVTDEDQINKPIDFFVNFWNGLLSLKE
ncbi:MAG: biotin/lipoyl-binding protein [Patescibacteria group bacterium]